MSAEELEQEYDRLSEELHKAWSYPPNLPQIIHLSVQREKVLKKWLGIVKEKKRNV